MMRGFRSIVLVSGPLFASLVPVHVGSIAAAAERTDLCPGYTLVAPIEPELSEAEVGMICGFPEAEGTEDQAWARVPRNQALLSLRAALQQRAYHAPEITEVGDGIAIDPGERTEVSSVAARGAPQGFDITRRRIEGELLTPAVLDDLEAWAVESLQRLGFPCPVVASAAGAEGGRVVIDLEPGERRAFGPAHSRGAEERLAGQLERFHAFRADWPYERTATEATSARLVESGLVESAQIVPACVGEAGGVVQDIVPGEPRLVSVQLAFNSEEYLRVRGRLVHRALLGDALLLSEATALASGRVQQVTAATEWYPGAAPSRRWIEPLLLVRRADERFFEFTTAQLQVAYGRRGDFPGVGWTFRAGPNIATWDIRSGPGPDHATALSFRAEGEIRSHGYEVYRARPQEGWALDMRGIFAHRDFASDFSAQYVELGGVAEINATGEFPPRLGIGLRGRIATTFTGGGDPARLPPEFRHYLGGMADLRGFRRLSLAPDGSGGLTRAAFSVELRPDLFTPAFEPIVFADAGALGEDSARFDGPLYWSLGMGATWNSPVGPVRATLAHGWAAGDAEGLHVIVSWGETF